MRSACRPTTCASAAWRASCCGWAADRASSKRSAPSRATKTAAKPRRFPRPCPAFRSPTACRKCAGVMNDLAIIRSMTSKEGSHPRASFLLHHGYLPMGGVKFPDARLAGGPSNRQARNSICRASCGLAAAAPMLAAAGFLGVDLRSVRAAESRSASRKTRSRPRATSATPAGSSCSSSMEANFGAVEGADIVADHQKLHSQVVRDDSQPADGRRST